MFKMFKKYLNDLPISEKFKKDVFWNVGSLFVLGVAGIIMNILIARFYGADTLGIFNQVYAVYILASQFAAGSIHLSTQKHIAEFSNNQKRCDKIISSAVTATFVLACLVTIIIFFLRGNFGSILKSPAVSVSLIYTLPGLVFFAVNKTLMAIFNGFRLMKSYALAQTLRYLLMVVFLVLAIILEFPGEKISFIFSGAEIVLFFYLIIRVLSLFQFVWQWGDWLTTHLIFSYKALPGNIMVDVNTRVDVLILGYFASDRIVGIYSFAAILAEGFSQLLIVLKTNINPILARLSAQKKKNELQDVIRLGVRLTYPVTALLGLLTIFFYPIFVKILVPGQDFSQSWGVFIILIVGIILGSGYLPFQMLLAQAGFPLAYTNLITLTFLANVVFNLLLVPILGMEGSALATSLSVLLSVVVLKIYTLKMLKIKI